MEELTREDIAAIARMDEQISGLREDMRDIRQDNREIKQSIVGFTAVVEKQTELYITSIKDLSERHYTKEETGLMVQARDNEQRAQDREIKKLTTVTESHGARIEKLEKKWSWLTGVGAVLVVLLGIGEAAIRLLKG